MPHIINPITPQGCELDVYIGASQERLDALLEIGAPEPSLQIVRMIIDTGASATAIDEKVAASLGLTPTGTVPILTPSTDGTPKICMTYDILLAVHHEKAPLILSTLPVIAINFDGQNIQGLIGCDVLERCLFILDGVSGKFTLAF